MIAAMFMVMWPYFPIMGIAILPLAGILVVGGTMIYVLSFCAYCFYRWGFFSAIRIAFYSPRRSVKEIETSENPFEDPCVRPLALVAKKIGAEQEILFKDISPSSLKETLQAMVLFVLPLVEFFVFLSVGFYIMTEGPYWMMFIGICLVFFVVIFVFFSTHVKIITRTHFISFSTGLSSLAITCIPIDQIKEFSLMKGLIGGSLSLTFITVHGDVNIGKIPNVPKFLEAIQTLGFREKTPNNPQTNCLTMCCGVVDSPFRLYCIIFGIFQLMILALFIGAIFSGSLLFIMESSIAPMGAYLFSFIITLVVTKTSMKKIIYEHPERVKNSCE